MKIIEKFNLKARTITKSLMFLKVALNSTSSDILDKWQTKNAPHFRTGSLGLMNTYP